MLDSILHGKAEELIATIPEKSVHLVVTSPPYFNARDYSEYDNFHDYMFSMATIFAAMRNVLVDGARVCINVANYGRNPVIPLHMEIRDMMEELGYDLRTEIIWDKGTSAAMGTAWGSWKLPSNPNVRDVHEYILVFNYGSPKLDGDREMATMTKEEFLEFTKSVWQIRTASSKKIGHPAPYPVEIPYRLIQLFSYKGNTVLDPFMGSGTTAVAAIQTGRHYIGCEIHKEYLDISNTRIQGALVA